MEQGFCFFTGIPPSPLLTALRRAQADRIFEKGNEKARVKKTKALGGEMKEKGEQGGQKKGPSAHFYCFMTHA